MRLHLFLICLISFNQIYSFNPLRSNKLTRDSLNEFRYILEDGWRFHPGDNTNWATPEFNDSGWIFANSLVYPDTSSNWNGIGWFRMQLDVDSSLLNSNIGMQFLQAGASDIYFNGELVYSIGSVGLSKEDETVLLERKYPKILKLTSDTNQVIAVRYSNFTKPRVDYWGWKDGFYIILGNVESLITERVENDNYTLVLMGLMSGMPLLFSILHLFMYFFYRKEIANLYYGILTMGLATMNFIELNFNFISDPTKLPFYFALSGFFAILSIIFILLFAFDSFKSTIPKHFVLFIVFGIVLNVLSITNLTDTVGIMYQIFLLLAIGEIGRVIAISVKRKRIKLNFLVAGFTLFIICLLYQILSQFEIIPNILDFPIYFIGLLILIISMSIHLSQDFARINKELEREIETVKELSKQKIEQEIKSKERELEQKLLEADNERKTKELEEARTLQLSMLPKNIPHMQNVNVAAHMITATEVGGDYYDFYRGDDGLLTFAIGDATGHGMKAGTLVSATKSLFNALVDKNEPLWLLTKFNEAIKNMNLPNLFISLLIAKLDGYKLSFANSGMPPILIYQKEHNRVIDIKQKSLPIGGRAKFPYKQSECTAKSGDVFLFASDGLYELFNENDELLGLEKAKSFFQSSLAEAPQDIINNMLIKISEWSNGRSLHDDLTLIVLSFK
jgi:serine phosphatase RsbU (regulator of sigma subunit)